MDEQNEFMIIPKDGTDEPRSKTLEEFARDVLADPEYQRSVEARAKSGKLTPAESRMLLEVGRRQQEVDALKPRPPMAAAVAQMNEQELQMFANLARRMIAAESERDQVEHPHERAKIVSTKRLLDGATEFELQIILNVCRRVEGQPDNPILVPGTNAYLTMAEMLATLKEVYKP